MGRVRKSCRGRKSRSRLSRSCSKRRVLATKSVNSCEKRLSSQIDENVAQVVAKELNFAELNRTPLSSTGRRRSDRLLRRKSLEKNSALLTPSVSGLIPQGYQAGSAHSREQLVEGSTLKEIELIPGDSNKIVESMFGDVFDKASLFKIEVEQCVSLAELRVRPLHQFGIQRAVHLLRGNSIGSVTGHVCVGKFPVVAELPEEYLDKILEYFCRKGRDREASKRFIASKPIYQVINGGYEHEGRWRLIDSSGYQFAGVKWRTVQIPWQDPKILRAISIMSSQVQKKELVVDLSFADEMVHLRRIIEEHIAENAIVLKPGNPLPRGFCKDISKVYSGGKDYSNSTLRHLISIAAKMSMRTTLLMRQIIDQECPSIAKSIHRKGSCEDSPDIIDTRVFRTVINSKSLKGAKAFFASDTSDEDRQNAFHRICYLAQEMDRYKGVDNMHIDKQVEAAISGRKAIEKFRERILRKDTWPSGMKPLLQNILWTTKLDPEISENRDKPDELLVVLKHNYLEFAGVQGGARVEQYEKFVRDQTRKAKENIGTALEQQGNNLSSPSGGPDTTSAACALGELILEDGDANSPVEAEERDDSGISQALTSREDSAVDKSSTADVHHSEQEHENMVDETDTELEPSLKPLQQCNIEIHARTWEDYNKSVLNEQATFDFVFSDPFQKPAASNAPIFDDERRIEFVKFIKKVLVPGGYVFVIVPQLQMSSWLDAFEEFELKPEGIFTLVKDPESVQRVKGKSFQHLVEVAAVARKNGRHPTKFVTDVISPYTQLPRNRYKRRAPIIDNIAPPANRLHFPRSKTLVRTGEKPPGLIWELMKTFCPPGGNVLDPCAGTLTTGIAGIQSGRPCVLLESDKRCLSLAETRLTDIAVNKLKEAQTGNILSELETGQDVLGSTVSEERGGTSAALPPLDEAELDDVSEHDTEAIEGQDMNEYVNSGSPSGSGDVALGEKDVTDSGCRDDQEDESDNSITKLPVSSGCGELLTSPMMDSCLEKPHREEALDQKHMDLNESNDRSINFNSLQQRAEDSGSLETGAETPEDCTERVTHKGNRRNQPGNRATHDTDHTALRPQRKRKRNIRYQY